MRIARYLENRLAKWVMAFAEARKSGHPSVDPTGGVKMSTGLGLVACAAVFAVLLFAFSGGAVMAQSPTFCWNGSIVFPPDRCPALPSPPTADSQSVSTDEDTALEITLAGSDANTCELTFEIVDPPASGSLGSITNLACSPGAPGSGNSDTAKVTYTPSAGFSGSDSFTFLVRNSWWPSPAATVSITVNPANTPPTAASQSVSTDEDTALNITLAGSDAETCDLTFTIVNAPSRGALGAITDQACAAGAPNTDSAQVTYTPDADFNGPDSFTYQVSDGSSVSAPVAVSIFVSAVNDAPVVTVNPPSHRIVDEGIIFSFSGDFYDVDTANVIPNVSPTPGASFQRFWSPSPPGTTAGHWLWSFSGDGPRFFGATVTATDGSLGGGASFSYIINNVAPTATFSAASPIEEGGAATVSFSNQMDPSAADVAAGFRYSIACDGLDASLATTYGAASPSAQADCTFPDNGSFTVKGRIFDKDNGHTTYDAVVEVTNVAPKIAFFTGPDTVAIGAAFAVWGEFEDVGADTHTLLIEWGDGTSQFISYIVAGDHAYWAPGSYDVTLTVTDKDGGSDTATLTIRVLPPQWFSQATDAGGCAFDKNADLDGSQFNLIFTQDPTAPNAYRLTSSNPGQFYYNVYYHAGAGGQELTINIPAPFITKGAVPVQIYDGLSESGACYRPGNPLGNQASLVSGTTGGQIAVNVPANTTYYITIHLDYGLKGTTGWSKDLVTPTTAINGATSIANLASYTFDTSPSVGSSAVQSQNVFKRNPGIGGSLLKASNGDPLANVRVQIHDGSNKLLGTVATDADGYYTWTYKYTGKPASFVVSVPAYGRTQAATLRANGFLEVNFPDLP